MPTKAGAKQRDYVDYHSTLNTMPTRFVWINLCRDKSNHTKFKYFAPYHVLE